MNNNDDLMIFKKMMDDAKKKEEEALFNDPLAFQKIMDKQREEEMKQSEQLKKKAVKNVKIFKGISKFNKTEKIIVAGLLAGTMWLGAHNYHLATDPYHKADWELSVHAGTAELDGHGTVHPTESHGCMIAKNQSIVEWFVDFVEENRNKLSDDEILDLYKKYKELMPELQITYDSNNGLTLIALVEKNITK